MRIFVAIAFLCLTSCAVKTDLAGLMADATATRTELMRKESDVYGDFFRLRTFHLDLMQVVNHTDQQPYPMMDSLFYDMKDTANAVIILRMSFDTTFASLSALCEGKKREKLNPDQTQLVNTARLQMKEFPVIQKQEYDKYFRLRNEYQDSCTRNGIKRLSLPEYAALTSGALEQWQDSLEAVGRMVADEKRMLKEKFPAQKGPEFMTAYQPVSQLEKLMKDFESQIAQLENSVSRFEEANKQDYIYFGKDVRRRMEPEVTDGILGALSILMKDCRTLHAAFGL